MIDGDGRAAFHTTREAIRRVHASYLQGAIFPPPAITLDHYEITLQKELYLSMAGRIGPTETKLLRKCALAYSAGVQAARHNQIVEACRQLGAARIIQESLQLSREAQLLAKTFLGAAEAYLDYRCKDYDAAKRRLCESLATDEELETRHGAVLMHVHRLHLVNNLVHMEVQRVNIGTALDMAAHLAAYMQGTCSDAPAPGNWGGSYRDVLPADAIKAMFVQVMGEIGQALAGKRPGEALPLFAIIEKRVPQRRPFLWHPLAFQWFTTKQAFVAGETERYFDLAADYLRAGVTVAPLLWRLVALDVAMATENLMFDEASELLRDILSHARAWPGMSPGLRTVVQTLEASLDKHTPRLAPAQAG